jgi:hypothetical protein
MVVLLGLYFLSAQEGLVDLKNLTITFRHEKVCAELADSRANLTVSDQYVSPHFFLSIFPLLLDSLDL